MISGLQHTYDIRHHNRLNNELKHMGGKTETIPINTKKIETICDEYNIKHINYLSIDVEGGEYEVIKSINFDKVFIDVIGFENNYNDTSIPIIKYLNNYNFIEIKFPTCMDIFMINKKSKFI
jgi:hypothetical protein